MKKQSNPLIVLDNELPEVFIEQLIELQITQRIWFFTLGDTANRIWQWCREKRAAYRDTSGNQMPFTFELVCQYVAYKLDDGVHGAASVRKYADIASIFSSQRVREKFERLPISHWEYASQFAPQDAMRILNFDLDSLDRNQGRPISLKRLQAHFEPEKYGAAADQIAAAPHDRLEAPGVEDILTGFIPSPDLPVDFSELRSLNSTWQVFHQQLLHFVQRNPGAAERLQPILQKISQDFKELVEEIKSTSIRE